MRIKQKKTTCPQIAKYPPVLPFGEKLSETMFWEIHDKCMTKAKENMGAGATPWIHLQDAVSRGTITQLEAMDAIDAGYLPENLKTRESAYNHLL